MAFNAGAIVGTAKLHNAGWTKGIKGMKSGLGVLTAAVGVATAIMVKSTQAANEWQKELKNVNTLLDTTTVNSQDLAKSLLSLDSNLGETTELTTAMYQAFSSGAEDMDEALKITTDSAKFAKAAVTDTATAVDVLTTAQNAYGKDTVTTAKASDIFFTTIKQGKLTGEQLASTIGKSIPLFASLNIPLEELGSGMAAMTKQGVNSAEATTQLNGIVNSFLKPSADMTAALKEQGIESGSALLETQGLSGALEFLETASGGSKDELSKLLPSVEAVRGTLALTGKGGEEFNKILKEMEGSAGATDIAFKKQEDVLANMQVAFGKVELVVGNIGKVFQDKIAVGATEAAEGMLDFLMSASGMETIGNIVGGAAGAFDLLKNIITPLFATMKDVGAGILSDITETLGELGVTSGDSAGAFELLSFVMEAGSSALRIVGEGIGLVIGVLGDLVTAVIASGQTVGSFFDFLKGDATWDEVKENAGTAKDAFLNLGTGVAEAFVSIGTTVVEEVTGFTEKAKFRATEIEGSFKLAFDNSKTFVLDNIDEMVTGQENGTNKVIDSNKNMTETVGGQNKDLAESTKLTFQEIGQGVLDFIGNISEKWSAQYDAVVSVIDTGLSSISEITSLSYQNELDELELSLSNQLEAINLFHDSKIEGLRELTDEELALDQFKKDEKIALLQASTDEEDQLELAALLAKEGRLKSLAEAEQAKADAIALTEAEALKESNKIAKSQFETQKSMQIASVWMDTASAIAGFWSVAPMLGPIAGPIFGGAMSAAMLGVGGAQTSLISEQQFIPARETGGMAGGLTRINEAGGEIVTLPDGSQVIPNDISQQIATNSGNSGNIINIDFGGVTVRDDADIEEIADRVSMVLGEQLRSAV